MTITVSPAYPVAGEEVTVTVSSDTAATYVRLVLTSVPSRSTLATYATLETGDGEPVYTFTPDVQGVYQLAAYRYRKTYGLGSDGSAVAVTGDATDELASVETTSVYVGAYADLPVMTAEGHGATLRLVVASDTVRAASLVDHTTERARMAALQSGVVSALAALEGVTVANLDDDLVSDTRAIRTAYNAHRVLTSGPVHRASGDTQNVLTTAEPYSVDAAIVSLNELHDVLTMHMSEVEAWHLDEDTKNLPVARKATDLASAVVLRADLRERVYERHRVQTSAPASHDNADSTNTLSAPKPLTSCIVAYLDAIVTTSPTAGVGEQEGAGDIANAFGFTIRDEV